MKKSLLTLLGAGLLLTSCQSDEPFAPGEGGEKQVTFTLNVPGELGTRAGEIESGQGGASNVGTANIKYTLVLDAKGDKKILDNDDAIIIGDGTATFKPTVVLGRNYTITAYASLGDAWDGENAIDITKHFNDETKDAYFHTTTHNFADGDLETLSLKRPFGKLRLLATDYKVDNTNKLNTAVESVTITYNDAKAAKFNAFNSEFVFDGDYVNTGAKDFGYYAAESDAMPIFADYIPANSDDNMVDFTVTVKYAGSTETYSRTFNDIPVRRNALTTLKGNFFTAGAQITVEVDDDFDNTKAENIKFVSVGTNAELQDALDKSVPGTIIKLNEGVNYGVVYMRPVAGNANTVTDCDYLVYRNEMLRKVEDLTIVGAAGATIDAIKVVAGHIEGSTGYVVDIKNLVIDSVEFTDSYNNPPHSYSAPLFFDLTYTNIDGLTVKNCVLKGQNDKMNFVYLYGSGNPSNSTFETAAKNITITDNTVDGIARLCELRQTENVTITNNIIKNTAMHGMLLATDNGSYSGNVTITDNVADGLNERFVRMAGAGNAAVVIKNNKILNHKGADVDYIKVTDGNNVTIEDNFFGKGAKTADELKAALAAGQAVVLTNDINIGKIDLTTGTSDVVIDANGHTITTTDSYGIEATAGKNITIKNATIGITKHGDYITYAAGLKIANGDYAGKTIKLENCKISMANTDWAYAVTMPASVINLNLVLNKCELEGAIAVQCWGDKNTITITNSKLICNYTTNALYTSYCVVLQGEGANISEENNLTIDNCDFLYSGVDNFNSPIYAIRDRGLNNTTTATNCTYGEKIVQ